MRAVREVEIRRRRVDATLARADALAGHEDAAPIQADYARHVCILVSGFIEKSVAELVLTYAEDKSARQVVSYLSITLGRLTNVDSERLLRVIGSLDASWRVSMEAFLTDQRRQALDSVVGLRNDIAHGGGGSLTLGQIRKYWITVQEVTDELERLLLPVTVIRRRVRR